MACKLKKKKKKKNIIKKKVGGGFKFSLKKFGGAEMIVESADISNGYLHIEGGNGDGEKILSSFTSGQAFETSEGEERDPRWGLESSHKEEYTGKAGRFGFSFEYDPSQKAGGLNAEMVFNANGYKEYHRYKTPDQFITFKYKRI